MYEELLTRNSIKTVLNIIYVDDKNWGGEKLKAGTRWDNEKKEMRWEKEWEREDIEKDEPSDRRTMQQLRAMANSIKDDNVMKEDVGSNHSDGTLPMLDVRMWVERDSETGEQEIKYKFYEKEMVSRLVLMERSALPIKTKIQIMVQEIVRRSRNTHRKER